MFYWKCIAEKANAMCDVYQYLKSCNAVWVVSSVHRAVNDKTARDLLGEHFRRQLLMDGQYGSVSFICSKTDILNSSEIIRYFSVCGDFCSY